jgi:hypothetical protein
VEEMISHIERPIMGWLIELKRRLDDWKDHEFARLIWEPQKLDTEKIKRAYGEIIDILIERALIWCEYFSEKLRSLCYGDHIELGVDGLVERYIFENDFGKLASDLKRELIQRLGVKEFERLISEVEKDLRLIMEHNMERAKRKEEDIGDILYRYYRPGGVSNSNMEEG